MLRITIWLLFLSVIEVGILCRAAVAAVQGKKLQAGTDFLEMMTSTRKGTSLEVRFYVNWLVYMIAIRMANVVTGYENAVLRHLNTFVHVHEFMWFTLEVYLAASRRSREAERSFWKGIQRFSPFMYFGVLFNACLFLATDIVDSEAL